MPLGGWDFGDEMDWKWIGNGLEIGLETAGGGALGGRYMNEEIWIRLGLGLGEEWLSLVIPKQRQT